VVECSFLTNDNKTDQHTWCRFMDIPCINIDRWDMVCYPGYPCSSALNFAVHKGTEKE